MLVHDIKLQLDAQPGIGLSSNHFLGQHPTHAIDGEEGVAGDPNSPFQWIVDPIDGTVNYLGIPHFCILIALREGSEITHGVIYDPMLDELFTVGPGIAPTRNGKPISVSKRAEWKDAVITIGFSKSNEAIDIGLERYRRIAHKVRKTRMLGSAALGMAYIACGRLDAYSRKPSAFGTSPPANSSSNGPVAASCGCPNGTEKFGVVSSNGLLPVEEMMS